MEKQVEAVGSGLAEAEIELRILFPFPTLHRWVAKGTITGECRIRSRRPVGNYHVCMCDTSRSRIDILYTHLTP